MMLETQTLDIFISSTINQSRDWTHNTPNVKENASPNLLLMDTCRCHIIGSGKSRTETMTIVLIKPIEK